MSCVQLFLSIMETGGLVSALRARAAAETGYSNQIRVIATGLGVNPPPGPLLKPVNEYH